MLKKIDAPLKLVIAGNHDFTMDITAFEAKLAEASQPLDPEIVAREYGTLGQARQLFEDVRSEGIVFLDERTHHFTFENGAMLKVYASPYTPALGAWGFQYHPNHGRRFDIEEDTDIVMTHGPPKGIMDISHGRERAGCPDLFTAIDNENSPLVERLAALRARTFDSDETAQEKRAKVEKLEHNKCAATSHCSQDDYQLGAGKETLFVNASIMGYEDFLQRPWLVDLELTKHTVS